MSANYDWPCPARNGTWNTLQNNRLTEYCSAQYIPYSTIWTLPHALQLELLHTGFIGGDSSALDANGMFEDSFSSLNGHFIIRSITVLQSEIEILDVDLKVWKNELLYVKEV